jgi:lipid-A-disaccharide synthase
VHFVCPSVWAWRAEPLEKIRRSVDHVLCMFPFEPALLRAMALRPPMWGIRWPDVIPMVPDRRPPRTLGLRTRCAGGGHPAGQPALGNPVSGAAFLQAARCCCASVPRPGACVPAMPGAARPIEASRPRAGVADSLQIVTGQSHTALAACDVTLIASGTATLEAALFKRPMVIAYNMHWLSWQIMRRKKLQPWVGLPNILCRRFRGARTAAGAGHAAGLATPSGLAGRT